MIFLLPLLLAAAPPTFEESVRDGMAALQRNELALARQSLETATRLAPGNAAAWFLLAQTYARQDNMMLALPAAERASRNAGKDATILYNLAVFYRDANLPDESIAHALRSLAAEDSADVRTLLGKAYARKREWTQAIAHFKAALRLAPPSEESVFNLAQACLQAQDFGAAVEVLEAGRKTFDHSPQIELALGVAYYGQRRFALAVDSYLRVMEIAPDIPQPYYFVSRILEHARDRIPQVTARAEWFEQHHSSSPLGFLLHAKALILQLPASGFPAEAQRASQLLSRALSIDEKQAEAHYLIATLFERQGDLQSALSHLQRSAALDPNAPAAHFRLARIYDRLGRKEEAAAERALHEKLSNESAQPQPPNR